MGSGKTETDRTARAEPLPHDHARHLRALTGVRLLAALWVVVVHFKWHILAIAPGLEVVEPAMDGGYLGVDLFFTLSGFILAYNYLHRFGGGFDLREYGRFLWVRLARIWPVHFFTLNVFVLMMVVGGLAGLTVTSGSLSTDRQSYVENVFLVHIWWSGGMSFNGPAWSVSAEWFAYLLFPFFALGVVRFRSLWAATIATAVSYGALVLAWTTWFWDAPGATTGALTRVATEFLAGCFLYMVWERIRERSGRGWSFLATAAVVALVGSLWLVPEGSFRGIVFAPLCGLVVLGLANGTGIVTGALSTRAMVFGGEVSYSIYMTHGLVQPVANKLFPFADTASQPFPIRLGIGLVLAVMVAAAAVGTYLVVEKPARNYMRGMLQRPGARVSS